MVQETPYDKILKIRHEVMYPDKGIEFVKLADDSLGIHMGYYVNGEVVSVVSLFLKDNKLQFRKLATLDDVQGRGYGTKLMEWILDYAKEMNFESIWCNARQGKISFYKKFGFEETNKVYQENGYTYVVVSKSNSN